MQCHTYDAFWCNLKAAALSMKEEISFLKLIKFCQWMKGSYYTFGHEMSILLSILFFYKKNTITHLLTANIAQSIQMTGENILFLL